MSQSTSNEKSFFNIHTKGFGYLERVREVQPKNGRKNQSFLACTVVALIGSAADPTYRYFDVRVSGAEAKKLVEGYIGVDDPKNKPVVRFRLGDLWADAFIRPKGKRQGEAAASVKARLLKAELLDANELNQVENFELITTGIGYLKRPEEVTPANSDAFLGCTLAALCGAVDEPDYRYIDTVVTATEAQHLVRRCMQAVSEEKKVLMSFRLNDMKAEPYIRTQGEHAGEAGANLKSTLIHIGLIKVDGQQVYPIKSDAEIESVNCGVNNNIVDESEATVIPDVAARVPTSQSAQAASF